MHPDDLKKVRDIIRRGQGEEGKKHRREFFELHPFSYRRRRKDGTWADLELGGTTDVRPASTAALVRLATRILS